MRLANACAWTGFWILALAASAAGSPAVPQAAGEPGTAYRVSGLELRLAADGAVRGVAVGGSSVRLLDAAGGFEVAEYSGATHAASPLKPKPTPGEAGLDLQYDGGKLALQVDVKEEPNYVRFHGRLKDTSGKDRALIVSFTLPVNTWGWTWWDDPNRARRISRGTRYSNYGYLGEQRDIAYSRYPFMAVSQVAEKCGLAMAVPQHHPRIFRLSGSAEEGCRVEFDLGLSAATTKFPGEADFTFVVYACDPVWGMRSAAERYYAFFPELFAKRVQRDGGSYWLSGSIYNPPEQDYMPPRSVLDEYGVGYVWLANEPLHQPPAVMQYVRENHMVAIRHREPWARWHLVYPLPDHPWYSVFPRRHVDTSGVPPAPTTEQEMAMLREETRMPANVRDGNDQIQGPVRDVAQATLNCLVYDEHDKPRITLWHRWDPAGWHSQIPLNVDPDIPEPNRSTMARKYQFPNTAGWGNPNSDMANAVSWDSTGGWTGFHLEDFRRDNFQYLDEPLAFHYATGRLMTLCGFHDFEMAQQWCKEARAKDGYIMANTDTQPMLFLGQFLDMASGEFNADNQGAEEMLLSRCLMYRKPDMLYRTPTEVGFRRMLALGMYPASVPVPGRDAGEGTTPAYRRLYLKYARRSVQIAAAGWEPVTHARAFASLPETDYVNGTRMKLLEIGGQKVYQSADDRYEVPDGQFTMERFGDGSKGLYFTLRSASAYREAIVYIDVASLKLAGRTLQPEELIEGRPVAWEVRGGMMRVVVPIQPSETLLLSLVGQ